jgi:endonuclease/exonuclease/phosphatase family metal-dependent hydrolase
MEWMKNLFVNGIPINNPPPSNKPEKDWNKEEELTVKSQRLISVLSHLDADIIAVIEGPDTLVSGTKTAKAQLETWMTTFNLTSRNYKVIEGFTSSGQQELCAIYDADKLILEHTPEGNNSFNEVFIADTLEKNIKEQYRHWRPPVELTIKNKADQKKLFKMIIAHAKSKGIFDKVDYARYEYLSELNRRKLYAECLHMRERVDKWIKEGDKVLVTGDINDGMGSDFYEKRFGKSAVEILLGNVYEPELILKSALGRPKLKKYGWTPSSSSFVDMITKNWFTVLIDHILVSQDITITESGVLNPYIDPHKASLSDDLKEALKKGSDHFPVYTEIDV